MLETKAHSHVSGGNVTDVECQGTLYAEGRRMAFCRSLRSTNLEWEIKSLSREPKVVVTREQHPVAGVSGVDIRRLISCIIYSRT